MVYDNGKKVNSIFGIFSKKVLFYVISPHFLQIVPFCAILNSNPHGGKTNE